MSGLLENPTKLQRGEFASYKRSVVESLQSMTSGGYGALGKSRAQRLANQHKARMWRNYRHTIGPAETAGQIARQFKLCENPVSNGTAGALGFVAVVGLGAAAYFAYQDMQNKKKLKDAGLAGLSGGGGR